MVCSLFSPRHWKRVFHRDNCMALAFIVACEPSEEFRLLKACLNFDKLKNKGSLLRVISVVHASVHSQSFFQCLQRPKIKIWPFVGMVQQAPLCAATMSAALPSRYVHRAVHPLHGAGTRTVIHRPT